MKKIALSGSHSLILMCALALLLAGCGAPIFHSDSERFAPAPEVIDKLQPYLEKWATLPAEQTKDERKTLGSQLQVSILVWNWGKTSTGMTVPVVQVELYTWGGYSRGYIYVHENVELQNVYKWELRRVDDHLYLYNSNE